MDGFFTAYNWQRVSLVLRWSYLFLLEVVGALSGVPPRASQKERHVTEQLLIVLHP